MKIYTKTGDAGETSLADGIRVSKADPRVDAYGNVDELNACIGLLLAQQVNHGRQDFLRSVQRVLFVMGTHLADSVKNKTGRLPSFSSAAVTNLECAIDEMQAQLPALRHFILPAGDTAVAVGHLARCVCRRAERSVARLAMDHPVDALLLQYLNRLSDYLFVLCRMMMQSLNLPEIPWKPKKTDGAYS